MDVASVLSAMAAATAATLSGLNLVVTGRREDRRWVRETATEAFVAYMDATFDTGAACRELLGLDRDGDHSAALDDLRRRIANAHEVQLQNLTRLRLGERSDSVIRRGQL